MSCPIQCSCGKNIAELHGAFELLYQTHVQGYASASNVHPSKLELVEGEVPNIVYIFDALGIRSMCCRNKIKNFRNTEKIKYRFCA